jgi:hypothetical protein
MRWSGCVASIINAYKTSVGKSEGRDHLGEVTWAYDIKMDLI